MKLDELIAKKKEQMELSCKRMHEAEASVYHLAKDGKNIDDAKRLYHIYTTEWLCLSDFIDELEGLEL